MTKERTGENLEISNQVGQEVRKNISIETPIALSSVQSLSRVQLFATTWTAARQTSLSITNCWSLPKPVSIELVTDSKSRMKENHSL